ncbi:hypothetical protein MVEN_00139300 [Mycena venus]|uniref:Uncharacterized protein n=1 Tax=Mycena venus TaxID=2733690 RepID=A0A8H6Z059_9AGAR|nr:hypothetical protein MVEN_00139300 [Mycena venus]
MATQHIDTQARLTTLIVCFNITVDTLEILANGLQAVFLEAIANTARSLLKNIETVRQNKRTCLELMEQTHELLNAIILLHIKSETGGILPPSVLNHIGRFTEQVLVKESTFELTTGHRTLHKIHTFVESQQTSSKIKQFFHQGEMNTLLKDCKNGLTQGLEFLQFRNTNIMTDVSKMLAEAKQRHQESIYDDQGLFSIPRQFQINLNAAIRA